MIYVIVPAYKAQDFIEECLDSIRANQIEHKIIVGVDGCEETLEKLKEIKSKYDNLTIVNFSENNGCYITLNSLVSLVPSGSYIQVFGADDMMRKDMLRIMFENTPCFSMYTGISMLHRSYYDKLGGYMPWRIAADTEFSRRLKKIEPNFKRLKQLFFRREHENQLTKSKETGLGSELRQKYIDYISKVNKNDVIYIEREVNNNFEII